MTRLHAFLLAVAVTLGGCSLFEPQYVGLNRAEVAEIVQQHGALSQENLDAWLDSVAGILKVERDEVVDLVKTAKGYVVELTPPGEEAIEVAVEKTTQGIAKSPGPQGIIAGAMAALFGIVSLLTRRKKLGDK